MAEINPELVRALVHEQFPRWRELPIEPVPEQGWDNRTFRLGADMSVRLPSAEGYVAGIEKEDRWLPELASQLPLPIPTPLATGRPGCGYAYPWSIRRWLPGQTITPDIDRAVLARDLGEFLVALRQIPAADGPAGGRHSHFRGCHPSVYGEQVQQALHRLDADAVACRKIWAEAITSAWPAPPVWCHGDVAAGNLLASDGKLSAVIDFGTCAVGDPACDLVIAWTYFTGMERTIFRESVGLDDDAWARARGWALWKALVTMAGLSSPDPAQRTIFADILADPVTSRG